MLTSATTRSGPVVTLVALLVLVSTTVVLAEPADDAPPEARASARALHVVVPGQEVIEAGSARAHAGPDPTASGASAAVGGQSPQRVHATAEQPSDVDSALAWEDDLGSMRIEGPAAEAHVTGGTASARGGVGTFGASGFGTANELFTWEQQEMLLTAWSDTNRALFGPLNDALGATTPLLEQFGLRTPQLEPAPAVGFLDVARGRALAANADAAASSGYAAASAATEIDAIHLLGGFIQASAVTASASADGGGEGTLDATASIGELRLAGIEVAARDGKLIVAGNDQPFSDLLQPMVDVAVAALEEVGATLRIAERRVTEDLAQATALLLELPAASGQIAISVGYAEATSSTVADLPSGQQDPPPPTTPETQPPDTDPPADPPADPAPEPTPSPTASVPVVPETRTEVPPDPVAAPPAPTDPPAEIARTAALRLPPLPAAVAGSLRAAYLLLIVGGGLLGALLLPALLRAPRGPRRAPILADRRTHPDPHRPPGG